MEHRENGTTIRLKREEREIIELAARHNGETVSGFIRRLALPTARRLARRMKREQGDTVSAASAA
jgi:uncharacterized protein (DUF1778 family)